MRPGSIRFRLLVAAVIGVVSALAAAEFGLSYLFERHVERRVDSELEVHANLIIAGITVTGDAVTIANPPTDPRFDRPLSGLYWQVEAADGTILERSRSLWDSAITVAAKSAATGEARQEFIGPQGVLLRAIVREVRIATPGGERALRITVATDHREISAASNAFAADAIPSLAVLAALLIAALWLQVSVGLAPLGRLRKAVADIANGSSTRLSSAVPTEIQPLVAEINSLLAARERSVGKARALAADLAHGMKTPLQVLAADVRTLRERGEVLLADEIDAVATTLRRHVDRQLARARIGGAAVADAAETNLAAAARSVVGVLARTPRGQELTFSVAMPEDLKAAIDEADLVEMLGSLAENASRFAASSVTLTARELLNSVEIAVVDDGPGIPEAEREMVLKRGVRLDLQSGGTGLGLAIVAETAEAYGGTFSLEDALPGLRAVVTLPRRLANRDAATTLR